MKSKVYIRADGNNEIGLGHVIRCLALADMLKTDFECIFVTRFLTPYIETEARKVCQDVIKVPENDHLEVFLSFLSGDEIVVLDNYFYSTAYQIAIKEKGCKLVCIDDIHDKHFVADVVINHAGGIEKSKYSVERYTHCFLGPDYVLLRPVFLKAALLNHSISEINDVFICFGGSDKYDQTLKVTLSASHNRNWNKLHVVVGQAYLHTKLFDLKSEKVNIYRNLSSQDMCTLLQRCNLAIIPASTICYEVFAVKMPAFLGFYVDNQIDIYNYFISQKAACAVDDYRDKNEKQLFEIFSQTPNMQQMQNQFQLIDGKSGLRILKIFNELC